MSSTEYIFYPFIIYYFIIFQAHKEMKFEDFLRIWVICYEFKTNREPDLF